MFHNHLADKPEDVDGVVEGLVQYCPGWISREDPFQVLSAELAVHECPEYAIAFNVAEKQDELELRIILYLDNLHPVSDERLSELTDVCSFLLVEKGSPMMLCEAKNEDRLTRLVFSYSWCCDQEIKDAVTIPVLCGILDNWSREMSTPFATLAPIFGLYLRGRIKDDNLFLEAAHDTLSLLSAKAAGKG